jgi:hypothetical protein
MAPDRFTNDLINAFGKQGGGFANVVTRSSTVEQMGVNEEKWKQIPTIEQQWEKYMGSFLGKWQYFATNFKNVVIDIFTPELPKFTWLFNELGGVFSKISDVLANNQGLAGQIGDVLIFVTAVSSIRFVTGIWQLSAAVAGFGRTVDAVKNKILLDELELGAGGALPGPVKGAAGKGFFGRILGALDNFFLAGLGGAALGGLKKLPGFFTKWIAAPIEGIGPWIMKLGQKIGLAGAIEESSILGNLGRLVFGIGSAGALLGSAVGGLLRMLLGPIGTVLSLSGDSGPTRDDQGRVWSNVYGRRMSPADLAAMNAQGRPLNQIISAGRKEQAGAAFDTSRRQGVPNIRDLLKLPGATTNLPQPKPATHPIMQVHVDKVAFELAPGTSQEIGEQAIQHFLSITGTYATHPGLPNPLTVGGSNQVHST